MVFLIMNSIGNLEGVKMLMMITTNFVDRLQGEVIEPPLHQVKAMVKRKVIETTDRIASSESKLPFNTNNMMLKARGSLVHYRDCVPGMKDIGSTVKL